MAVLNKFSFGYVKQHPVMFGVIVLVFGLLFWLLLSKHSSGGTSASATPSGPDPNQVLAAQVAETQAQLGAQTQVQLAQIAAGSNNDNNTAQIQLATLALQGQIDSIQANTKLGEDQLVASTQALALQLKNNLDITNSNNAFMVDYAKNAQDAATAQLMIGANLQEQLNAQNIDAMKFNTLVSTLPQLGRYGKEAVLDSSLMYAVDGGQAPTTVPAPPSGTGIGKTLVGIAGAVAPALAMMA